jgi:hypothetical protein
MAVLTSIAVVKGDRQNHITKESVDFWSRFLVTSSMSLEPVAPCKVAASLNLKENNVNSLCKELVVAPTTDNAE